MSYDEALAALQRALVVRHQPVARRHHARSAKRSGDRRTASRSVQVTGTNGKTSTARTDRRAAARRGLAVGLYTSPAPRALHRAHRDRRRSPVSDDDSRSRSGSARAARARCAPRRIGTPAGFTEFELLTGGGAVAVPRAGRGDRGARGRHGRALGRHERRAPERGGRSPASASTTPPSSATRSRRSPPRRPRSSGPAVAPCSARAPLVSSRSSCARAEAVATHARAVARTGEPSPVSEELTVRFRVVERPSGPDGHTVVDVRRRARELPGACAVCARVQAANIATAVAAAEAAFGRALRRRACARGACSRSRSPAASSSCATSRRSSSTARTTRRPPPCSRAPSRGVARSACRPAVLLGVLADKDARGIVAALAPVVGALRRHAAGVAARAAGGGRSPRSSSEVTGEPPVAVLDSVAEALAALLAVRARRTRRHGQPHHGRTRPGALLRDALGNARRLTLRRAQRLLLESAHVRPRAGARRPEREHMGELLGPILSNPDCSGSTRNLCILFFIVFYIALIFWTWRDANRRGAMGWFWGSARAGLLVRRLGRLPGRAPARVRSRTRTSASSRSAPGRPSSRATTRRARRATSRSRRTSSSARTA